MSLTPDSLTLRTQADVIAAQVTTALGHPTLEADPEKTAVLLAALADGNYRVTACRLAGISESTLSRLYKRAEAGEAAAIALTAAIEKAEALAESEMVGMVRKAAKSGPQFWAAGATFLERKAPDRWGKRQDDASVPRVVVQIGARDSDVIVSVGSITSALNTAIDATQVVPTSYLETTQVTEGSLSDADTERIKVAATQTTDASAGGEVPTGQRRGNRRGTRPGTAGAAKARRAVPAKGR